MAVTQPTLGGTPLGVLHNLPTTRGTFPQKDGGYRVGYEYRGGVSVMANGAVNFDLVATGAKRIVTFVWVNISVTARDAIMSALTTMGTGSAALVLPESGSITVTLDENMTLPTWESIGVPDGSGGQELVYSASVTLREV